MTHAYTQNFENGGFLERRQIFGLGGAIGSTVKAPFQLGKGLYDIASDVTTKTAQAGYTVGKDVIGGVAGAGKWGAEKVAIPLAVKSGEVLGKTGGTLGGLATWGATEGVPWAWDKSVNGIREASRRGVRFLLKGTLGAAFGGPLHTMSKVFSEAGKDKTGLKSIWEMVKSPVTLPANIIAATANNITSLIPGAIGTSAKKRASEYWQDAGSTFDNTGKMIRATAEGTKEGVLVSTGHLAGAYTGLLGNEMEQKSNAIVGNIDEMSTKLLSVIPGKPFGETTPSTPAPFYKQAA